MVQMDSTIKSWGLTDLIFQTLGFTWGLTDAFTSCTMLYHVVPSGIFTSSRIFFWDRHGVEPQEKLQRFADLLGRTVGF